MLNNWADSGTALNIRCSAWVYSRAKHMVWNSSFVSILFRCIGLRFLLRRALNFLKNSHFLDLLPFSFYHEHRLHLRAIIHFILHLHCILVICSVVRRYIRTTRRTFYQTSHRTHTPHRADVVRGTHMRGLSYSRTARVVPRLE